MGLFEPSIRPEIQTLAVSKTVRVFLPKVFVYAIILAVHRAGRGKQLTVRPVQWEIKL
jgi:hypothetical protein